MDDPLTRHPSIIWLVGTLTVVAESADVMSSVIVLHSYLFSRSKHLIFRSMSYAVFEQETIILYITSRIIKKQKYNYDNLFPRLHIMQTDSKDRILTCPK